MDDQKLYWLKDIEDENWRLKRTYTELALDNKTGLISGRVTIKITIYVSLNLNQHPFALTVFIL